MEALRDFGEKMSAVPSVVKTASTPAASAVRRIAPVFAGFPTLFKIATNDGLDDVEMSDRVRSAGLVARRTIP